MNDTFHPATPEDLFDLVADALDMGGFDDPTARAYAASVMRVVQPELDGRDAKIQRLTAERDEALADLDFENRLVQQARRKALRYADELCEARQQLVEAYIRIGTLRAAHRQEAAGQSAKPHKVCLSGSMRFEEEMRAAAIEESLSGHIVVMPNANMKKPDERWDDPADAERIKTTLDRLHLDKIDEADEVLVVAPGGYIGDSTRREIAYAKKHGKPVRYWVPGDAETCGDCIDGRCHWGSAQPGEECGCERHDASVQARGQLGDTAGGAA